ncbi:MAG: hypothetical protein ACK5Z3_10175 [Pseudanabaena sp.]|jgi:hypothetical protein
MDKALKILKQYQKAVKEAIEANHKLGLPTYEREGDYIIALYPKGRKVKLEKVKPFQEEFDFWNRRP